MKAFANFFFKTIDNQLFLLESPCNGLEYSTVFNGVQMIENVENLDEIVQMIEQKEQELGEIEKNLKAAVEAQGIDISQLSAAAI